MAFKCDSCQKGTMWGHKVSHSKQRTNRGFRPNLQTKRIKADDGKTLNLKLCTKCIKLLKKVEKDKAAKIAATSESPAA